MLFVIEIIFSFFLYHSKTHWFSILLSDLPNYNFTVALKTSKARLFDDLLSIELHVIYFKIPVAMSKISQDLNSCYITV